MVKSFQLFSGPRKPLQIQSVAACVVASGGGAFSIGTWK